MGSSTTSLRSAACCEPRRGVRCGVGTEKLCADMAGEGEGETERLAGSSLCACEGVHGEGKECVERSGRLRRKHQGD